MPDRNQARILVFLFQNTLNPFSKMFAERHTIKLPRFPAAPALELAQQKQSPSTLFEIAQQWIIKLESVLESKDASKLSTVLHHDSWWRDMLAFSWDIRTIHGLDKVAAYLSENWTSNNLSNLKIRETGKFAPHAESPTDGLEWVESMFDFETNVGNGSGMLRLVQGPDGVWKGHMIYTALKGLKGFEEGEGYRRPRGGVEKLPGGIAKGNWAERRQRQIEFLDEEPTVLIIGAGQSGLNLGARLQAMGTNSLIIDKNKRVRDN